MTAKLSRKPMTEAEHIVRFLKLLRKTRKKLKWEWESGYIRAGEFCPITGVIYCEKDEIVSLTESLEYGKRELGLSIPFCRKVARIADGDFAARDKKLRADMLKAVGLKEKTDV